MLPMSRSIVGTKSTSEGQSGVMASNVDAPFTSVPGTQPKWSDRGSTSTGWLDALSGWTCHQSVSSIVLGPATR